MRVLIAADKFKGSLTGQQVAEAIELGLRSANEHLGEALGAKHSAAEVDVYHCVVSDGGEGFLQAVEAALPDAQPVACRTVDPLQRPIEVSYLYQAAKKTAFVELAAASGYQCLTDDERDPSKTTTLGTGLVIKQAIAAGATTVYVGVGGSATNDGGIGMAAALGFRFLDQNGRELKPCGGALGEIVSIQSPASSIEDVRFFVINDVDNPLYGPNGAAAVYGPQKGADTEMVDRLDAGLRNLDACVMRDLSVDLSQHPGAGAAGGSGYGLRVFFDAEFCSGASFVLDLAGVNQLLQSRSFDWIITGEGMIDQQTQSGKLVAEVARTGKRFGVPVVAFCGVSELNAAAASEFGLHTVMQIHDPQLRSVQESIDRADVLLQASVAGWTRRKGAGC